MDRKDVATREVVPTGRLVAPVAQPKGDLIIGVSTSSERQYFL